jgi:hypothetical protein
MIAKTPKKFVSDERRFLVLKKNEVKIFEHRSPKIAIDEVKDSTQMGAVRRVFRRDRSERGKTGRQVAGGETAASCQRRLVLDRRYQILWR